MCIRPRPIQATETTQAPIDKPRPCPFRFAADFIGSDYHDQWGNDRARVLERMHEGFRYVRGIRVSAFSVTVRVERRRSEWTGRIWINGDGGETAESLKERVNSLPTPFQLEWHLLSGKPWDWKLVRVSNSSLEISADLD